MEPPRSHCQHHYTVSKQRPIPLFCLNCWSVLAYEPIKQIDVSDALIVLVEAERLTTTNLFLFTLAEAFHHFGWYYVAKIQTKVNSLVVLPLHYGHVTVEAVVKEAALLFFNTFCWSH